MGGYAGGEIASQIVVDTFIESFQIENDNIENALRETLKMSNHAIETYTHLKSNYNINYATVRNYPN